MSDISSISGAPKLTSQLKVSLESIQKQPEIEMATELKEIKQFEAEMQQVNQAFALAKEIRSILESSLRELG